MMISSPAISRVVVVTRHRVGSVVRVSKGEWLTNLPRAAVLLQSAIATHSVTKWCQLATEPGAGERQHAGRLHPCYRRRILGLRFADIAIRIVELAVEYSHPSIPRHRGRSMQRQLELLAQSNGDQNGKIFGWCATMMRRTCQSSGPRKIDPVVNLKAAQALGLTRPLPLLLREDEG